MYRPITSLTALARSTPRQLLRHSSSKSVSTSTPNHQRTSGLSYGAGALVALVVGTALVVRIAEMDGGRGESAGLAWVWVWADWLGEGSAAGGALV